MAWRSSPRAMWIWRRKSSIHTVGSVVPSYDSIFMGLDPSGNSCSITSSVKQRGCVAPLCRATSRRSSDEVCLGVRPERYCVCCVRLDGRRCASEHVPVICRSIWSVLLYCPGLAAGDMYIPELFNLCIYSEVVRAGPRLELPLCPDHVVVDPPHYALMVWAQVPRHRVEVATCALGNPWWGGSSPYSSAARTSVHLSASRS